MYFTTIGEINEYVGSSVTPLNCPEDVFELYSVPSFDAKYPEIVKGADIGSMKVTIQEGDVLICKINPRINRVWVVTRHSEHQLLASSEWIVVRSSFIDSNYLKWYFSSPYFRALLNSQVAGIGGSLTRAQPKQVAKYPVPVCSLNEQRYIALIMERLQFLIELRKKQLAKLDELVKAQFLEMFGDCRTNPKGWHIIPLHSLANVGSSKRVFAEELQSEGIPFFRGTEVGALAEGKDVTPELFITSEHYRSLCEATGAPQIGDLLMPSICPDGRIWLVDIDIPFYFKDGRVLWIHPRCSEINSRYLQFALKDLITTNYDSIASGTTFSELKIFALKPLNVMMPPIEMQKEFSSFFENIHIVRENVRQGITLLKILRTSMMQAYFGGAQM